MDGGGRRTPVLPVESRASRPQAAAMKKHPYTKPTLKKYGSVAALTKAVGMMSTTADGGMNPAMNKTS